MQLRKLRIDQFKNLRNFEIDFGPNLTTVLLGQNGAGKSNLLEALIILFRDLDLGAEPAFKYTLEYECRGAIVHIDADRGRGRSKRDQVQITVHEQDQLPRAIPYNAQFYEDPARRYLPGYVFGYYSGPGSRMEQHFARHQEIFYKDLLAGKEGPLRPLLYARPVHSQFALLSFFIEAEAELNESGQRVGDFLNELLGIEHLVSVLFIMREPPWTSKEGDARFWHVRGGLKDFLSHLYAAAFVPMYLKFDVETEFARKQRLEHLYLYLRSVEALKSLYHHYGNPRDFFHALESTALARILSDVDIQLRRRGADSLLSLRDMSEGEQQLLMVLGLLRFTKAEEALFLLDEPDTHLNPAWGVRYLEFMERVVGRLPTNQVIMTTHNPLVIASLRREDVRIMQRGPAAGTIRVLKPRENPLGMGVANILTLKEELSQHERQRLAELTGYLEGLGYALTEDDPLYAAFLKKLQEREDARIQQQLALTPQEHRARIDLVNEIIDELAAEGRWI